MPSELRKYLEYMAHIKAEYTSVMRFVVKERLGWGDGNWEDVKPRGGPFEYEGMAPVTGLGFRTRGKTNSPYRGHSNHIQ